MEPFVGLGWKPYRRTVVMWIREAHHGEEIASTDTLRADHGDFIAIDDFGFEHVMSPAMVKLLSPIDADDPELDHALDLWSMLDLSEV